MQLQDFSDEQFEISVTQTDNARYGAYRPGGRGHERLLGCCASLRAGPVRTLADGIYEQAACHVLGSLRGPADFGGTAYDFESWRAAVDWVTAVASGCNWGGKPYTPVGDPYRPDRLANNPTF